MPGIFGSLSPAALSVVVCSQQLGGEDAELPDQLKLLKIIAGLKSPVGNFVRLTLQRPVSIDEFRSAKVENNGRRFSFDFILRRAQRASRRAHRSNVTVADIAYALSVRGTLSELWFCPRDPSVKPGSWAVRQMLRKMSVKGFE